jgi:hypothetical protein
MMREDTRGKRTKEEPEEGEGGREGEGKEAEEECSTNITTLHGSKAYTNLRYLGEWHAPGQSRKDV